MKGLVSTGLRIKKPFEHKTYILCSVIGGGHLGSSLFLLFSNLLKGFHEIVLIKRVVEPSGIRESSEVSSE